MFKTVLNKHLKSHHKLTFKKILKKMFKTTIFNIHLKKYLKLNFKKTSKKMFKTILNKYKKEIKSYNKIILTSL